MLNRSDEICKEGVERNDKDREYLGHRCRSYNVPDDIDEKALMGELDALEADMGAETESNSMLSYLQPDLDAELSLLEAPSGRVPPGRHNAQVVDELGLPAVPRASLRG